MATRVRRRPDGQSQGQGQGQGQRKATSRRDDPAPIIPILARRVREVEARVARRGSATPTNRTKFQVVALLMRAERARVKDDSSISAGTRADLLKRLDGIATILAQIAARDTSLLALLDASAKPGPAAQQMRRDWLLESGAELAEEDLVITGAPSRPRPVVPPSSQPSRSLPRRCRRALSPTRSSRPTCGRAQARLLPSRLAGWELLGPLYRAFEQGAGGEAASMDLPPSRASTASRRPARSSWSTSRASSRACRRDTGPSCSPMSRAWARRRSRCWPRRSPNAYPMLAVVPNVVKINWAREVERWTPQRRVTVIHGDGKDVDAFADVFVVNYEILDRHFGWLSTLRVPVDGRRRGALHQEPPVPALAAGARPGRPAPGDDPRWRPAPPRPHRDAPHQRRQGLRRDLALPGLDQGRQAGRRDRAPARRRPAIHPRTAPSTRRPAAPSSTWASFVAARSTSQATCRTSGSPTSRSSSTTTSVARSAGRARARASGSLGATARCSPKATGTRSTASRTSR